MAVSNNMLCVALDPGASSKQSFLILRIDLEKPDAVEGDLINGRNSFHSKTKD